MGDGTRIRPHKAGGRDGWKGCTQHRGLRFCSIRVFTAAFQASGDSIHPLGIRLDCSPPRPTHVHARPFRDVHTEQNPSEPYMLASLHKAHGRSPSLCAAAGTRGTRSVGPTGVRFIPRDNSFPLSFEDSCLLVLVTKDLDVLFCTILFSESVFRKVTKKLKISLFTFFSRGR